MKITMLHLSCIYSLNIGKLILTQTVRKLQLKHFLMMMTWTSRSHNLITKVPKAYIAPATVKMKGIILY